ncbi:sugar-binding domain-containing protein [Pedobacter riviphilus]|uniref:sugar-binding domain-containing protein n=1 Tax=Pedobacter riviphilus TaxID=2766984 RepID=UPI001CC22A36|nr:sugar-binding domain-containing protein [Pedobacter riviphilus]
MYYKIVVTFILVCCTALPLLAQNSGIASALSPIPSSLLNSNKPVISLNGDWKFEQTNKKGSIKVPGEWVMQGYTVNTGETATYTKTFSIPNNWKRNRIKLRFDGVSSHAIVKINGKQLAEHEGSFVPFEIDITDALKSGENLLQVDVQANTISDILACTSQYAVHTVGGILRNVTLFALPDVNIADFTVVTTLDKNHNNAILNLNALVNNQGQKATSGEMIYTLTDAVGKNVAAVKTLYQQYLVINRL